MKRISSYRHGREIIMNNKKPLLTNFQNAKNGHHHEQVIQHLKSRLVERDKEFCCSKAQCQLGITTSLIQTNRQPFLCL